MTYQRYVVCAGGSKSNYITGFLRGSDTEEGLGKKHWLAQTFTLTDTYHIFRFGLRRWAKIDFTRWEYYLCNTDGAGKPVFPEIAKSEDTGKYNSEYAPGKFTRADFMGFPLLAPGVYAFVCAAPDAWSTTAKKWRCKTTPPLYPLGKAWHSDDEGATWTEIPNTTFMCQAWGYKPPPPAPPEPVRSNFAPLTESDLSVLDGFEIVVETDIPCHLFMRWSLEPPLKHPIMELRRGINIMSGVRYCFVAWRENEQEEEGDTLVHTFIKRDWPICQTRYFYFVGTRQLQESPSCSPIFTLHRGAEYKPHTFGPVACSTSGRTIRSTWGNWPPARNGMLLQIEPQYGAPWYYLTGGYFHTVSWWIYRSFLFFDTTDIPPGSLITGATISLTIRTAVMESPVYPNLIIEAGLQSDPVVVADWSNQNPLTTKLGEVDMSTLIPGQYNDIPLNDEGKAHINIGGITRFCLLGENDFANFLPPWLSTTLTNYDSVQKGVDFAPLLTVYYVPP